MSTTRIANFNPHRRANADEIRRSLGPLEDRMVLDILAAAPSLRDLADAALWQRGDGRSG